MNRRPGFYTISQSKHDYMNRHAGLDPASQRELAGQAHNANRIVSIASWYFINNSET